MSPLPLLLRGLDFILLNSCNHSFAALEHAATRYVCVVYTRREEEISCDKYKRKMTASAASEQIDLERNGERGEEKMREREKERQVVSGTIQLPSELYWISPPFKNKETNFSQSPPSGSQRKNYFIFPRQPGSP